MYNTIKTLALAGVSYKHTPLDIRNKFALTTDHLKNIYGNHLHGGLKDFFILSTCNRTEVYSTGNSAAEMMNLVFDAKRITDVEPAKYVYLKEGEEAIQHLFKVASGLDSQIIGDHEIVGQLKNAFALAKSFKTTSGLLEKLVNSALQVSKQVRARTSISNGNTSVSYAVIQVLRQIGVDVQPQAICLIGLGKIGTSTLKNIRCYLPQHRLTIINRSQESAESTAQEFNVACASLSDKDAVLKNAGILIVATAAEKAIITKADIEASSVKYIFDLSVPCNVDKDVTEIPGVNLFTIDELSVMVNDSIAARLRDVPMAEKIITEHYDEFQKWQRRHTLYTLLKNDEGNTALVA